MWQLAQRVGEGLSRLMNRPSAAEDERARERAHVEGMLEAWVGEAGVSDKEREQRKEAARKLEKALLHKVRFDSDEAEMAWLKGKAAEAGKREALEAWLGENSLDTPSKMREAFPPYRLLFVKDLGPNVTLENLGLLTSLPSGLHVNGDLYIKHCTSLSSLPDGLRVDGNMTLCNWTGPASLLLPNGLHVGGLLNLQGCTGLTSLPKNLYVGSCLLLANCSGLTSLSDGLHVGGVLNLADCTGLTSLSGSSTQVAKSMFPRDCTGLTSLPDGLHVKRDLPILGCTGPTGATRPTPTSVTSLPDGERVDGRVSLTSLPRGLRVDGHLNLERCTSLTSLPDSVLEWGMRSGPNWIGTRNIRLAGSGLPPEELARLQALDNPALRFQVSIDETETFGGGGGLDANNFPTLDEAAAFWAKEAGFPSELLISPFVEAAYVRGVMGFLSKLRRAKEFNNSLTKVGLAKRVVQVLELLTGEDNGVREELVLRMADAVDTCSDKPMWALNQMQVLVHFCKARGNRDALRALGMGVMRLEVVHKHVRKAMDSMNFIDDVCVYLRFEIALRESLQLPVSALEMLYPSYITVTQESIDAAEKEALTLKDEDLEAWLPAWSEWQRQDRVELAEELDFAALKRNSTTMTSTSVRSLQGSEVTDPVRLEPLAAVWSLQDLLKHWVNTGMDLNNTPRDVDYMRLNLAKCI